MCNCTGASRNNGKLSQSQWTGSRPVRNPSAAGIFPPPGNHEIVTIELNSLHERDKDFFFAFTVKGLEVVEGELFSQMIFSTYGTSKAMPDDKNPQMLTVSQSGKFPIDKLSVGITAPEDIIVYKETESGRLLKEVRKAKLLKVAAEVVLFGNKHSIEKKMLSISCPYPYELFWETKCVHDECGPSWAHYGCNYHCIGRWHCSNGNVTDWTDSGGYCGTHCV